MAERRIGWIALVAWAGVSSCSGPSDVDAGGVDSGSLVDSGEVLFDASPPLTDAGRDAGPPEPPCEPGATRVGECGFCGTQAQECAADRTWTATSACLGEGECGAGTVDVESLPMCAERQRICLAECTWTAFEMTAEPGECEVGAMRMRSEGCPAGQVAEETCDDTCGWVETMPCNDPCGGTARTTPEWKAEVCIPAGPFMRGTPDLMDAQPVVEVTLSAYYIDRYPVTNQRYRECMMAGACRPISAASTPGHSSLADPGRADYPVQGVYLADMRAFCAWDGGRRLPTEAEWEKAVRGPSPRTNAYPWDGTEYRCDLVNSRTPMCTYRRPIGESSVWAVDPYDGLPGSVSYYGTYLQYGGVPEFVSDYYSATYYADPSSRTDPAGPATGTSGVLRGQLRDSNLRSLARRVEAPLSGGPTGATGFRCARSSP